MRALWEVSNGRGSSQLGASPKGNTYLLLRTPRGPQHSPICKVSVKGRNEGEEKLGD